jgi:hypothetical protein
MTWFSGWFGEGEGEGGESVVGEAFTVAVATSAALTVTVTTEGELTVEIVP